MQDFFEKIIKVTCIGFCPFVYYILLRSALNLSLFRKNFSFCPSNDFVMTFLNQETIMLHPASQYLTMLLHISESLKHFCYCGSALPNNFVTSKKFNETKMLQAQITK